MSDQRRTSCGGKEGCAHGPCRFQCSWRRWLGWPWSAPPAFASLPNCQAPTLAGFRVASVSIAFGNRRARKRAAAGILLPGPGTVATNGEGAGPDRRVAHEAAGPLDKSLRVFWLWRQLWFGQDRLGERKRCRRGAGFSTRSSTRMPVMSRSIDPGSYVEPAGPGAQPAGDHRFLLPRGSPGHRGDQDARRELLL